MTSGRTSTGLDEPLAGALAYLLGILTGVLLLVVEKKSRYVRFHAMQSCVVFTAVLAASIVIWSIPFIGVLLNIAFVLGVVALWVLLMYKALSGVEYKVPYLGDLAERQVRH
jgi:uncharacterized membrane protein